MAETLLLNYMEFAPVGHVIELLRYALGYHAADPSRRISVLLAANSPRELAALCPFVNAAYPVSPRLVDLPHSLRHVPVEWDWIVDNPRRHDQVHVAAWDGLDRFFATTDRLLRPRCGRGVIGVGPPAYRPHQQLRLQIPEGERAAVRATLAGGHPGIAVMPAGSSGARWHYPSTTSWELILHALTERSLRLAYACWASYAPTSGPAAASPRTSSPGFWRPSRSPSTALTSRSSTSSPSSKHATCSSRRTPASAWPRSRSRPPG